MNLTRRRLFGLAGAAAAVAAVPAPVITTAEAILAPAPPAITPIVYSQCFGGVDPIAARIFSERLFEAVRARSFLFERAMADVDEITGIRNLPSA